MKPGKIRILLADDHAVLRAGLRALLGREPDMEVVGEAASGSEALRKVEELQPDVVLMDISMQGIGGLEATAQIKQKCPRARVLILTMHEDRRYLLPALRAGAAGYVVKRAADVELIGAIRAIQRGEAFLHPSMAKFLVEEYRAEKATGPTEGQALSDREGEVLRLIAEGLSYKEMAERLGISVKTVETYRERIKEKLNLHSRAEIVRYALERGLLRSSG
ncbi:MAG: response regulator transcription factor [Candidatus Rokubacteria bacterium]|nr:response regulator transcription factor [Candidatus Rokubacteria bacterium]